jgi:hypothetical protein
VRIKDSVSARPDFNDLSSQFMGAAAVRLKARCA